MADILLSIERALTNEQKEIFMNSVLRLHPRLKGANVADILELCSEHDSFIGEVEQADRNFQDTPNVKYAVYLTKYIPDLDLHSAVELVENC